MIEQVKSIETILVLEKENVSELPKAKRRKREEREKKERRKREEREKKRRRRRLPNYYSSFIFLFFGLF